MHALRNALIPVITVVGLQVGSLFGGAVLTETIFAWPGVGNWLIHGIQRRDYPVLQGGILMVATIVILVNLTVDILSGMVNPRMRHRAMSDSHRRIRHAPRRPAPAFPDQPRRHDRGRSGHDPDPGCAVCPAAVAVRPGRPDAPGDPAPADLAAVYPLGTDDVGRDVLSRLLFGARLSLSIGAVVVSLSFVVGTLLGLTAGFAGGVVDALVMRLMDIMLALPTLLLAIAVVAVLGPGLSNAMLAVSIVQLPGVRAPDARRSAGRAGARTTCLPRAWPALAVQG